ncbi:VPS37 C-terminal domain-containing protein [Durusdinium trenchii]|uniref:VPS37 C-terminal domain-containing protein n=1 Tax=Durusdinium trenchii TaxID=1381693 RepID=A0ABP0H684_9DINO
MTEQHLIEQEWDSLSKKRFSPGRLHSIWHDLDGQTRRRYRQLSTRAEEATDESFKEFDQLAMVENAKLKDQQKLWIEVCLGGGWTLERSVFFPRSALKCMLTLLLCHKRSTLSCAKDISHHVWLEHIFPFIPCFLEAFAEREQEGGG